MIFNTDADPDNSKLRDYFTWRATCVTKHQEIDLINKLANEIVMKGKFLALCTLSNPPEKTEDGKTVFPQGTKINYFSLTSKEGKKLLPVFTDRESLSKWKNAMEKDKVVMGLTFDDFVPILRSCPALDGVVINPMSDNFPMPKKLIADWMARKISLVKKYMQMKAAKDAGSNPEKGTDN